MNLLAWFMGLAVSSKTTFLEGFVEADFRIFTQDDYGSRTLGQDDLYFGALFARPSLGLRQPPLSLWYLAAWNVSISLLLALSLHINLGVNML